MNLDENTSFFRESFKGFNKDDVAAFIQKLSKDYSDNEEKYKDKIAKLTADNNAKTEEIANAAAANAAVLREAEKAAQQLKRQLGDKDAEIENLNAQLKSSAADADKYKDDANTLLSEVRSKDAEIIELKKNVAVSESSGDEIETLKIKYTELLKNNEELKYKLEESAKAVKESRGANTETVNELSAQVAELSAMNEKIKNEKDVVILEKDIIIEDLTNQLEQNRVKIEDEQKIYENVTAELGSIVYSAKKSAEELTANAKSEADDIVARANMKRLAILEENEKNLAQFREKYNFIKQEHDKIIESFNLISGQYSAKLLEMQGKIENISNNILGNA